MSNYRAQRALWYPTDRAAIRRIRAGERVPMKQRGLRRVAPGEILPDGVPRESLGWMLIKGWIEEVADEQVRV